MTFVVGLGLGQEFDLVVFEVLGLDQPRQGLAVYAAWALEV